MITSTLSSLTTSRKKVANWTTRRKCVRGCVRLCVRVRARVYVCVRLCVRACTLEFACVQAFAAFFNHSFVHFLVRCLLPSFRRSFLPSFLPSFFPSFLCRRNVRHRRATDGVSAFRCRRSLRSTPWTICIASSGFCGLARAAGGLSLTPLRSLSGSMRRSGTFGYVRTYALTCACVCACERHPFMLVTIYLPNSLLIKHFRGCDVRTHVCALARACACVRVCVRVSVRACVRACVHALMLVTICLPNSLLCDTRARHRRSG